MRAPNQSAQHERASDANRARNGSQDAQGRTSKYHILQETKTLTEILLRDLIPKQRDQGCCEELIRFLFYSGIAILANIVKEATREVVAIACAHEPRPHQGT